jgi:hypothetical protein
MNKFKAGLQFARIWAAAVPRLLYRTTLSMIIDPGGALRYAQNVLEISDMTEDDPVLGSMSIEEFLSQNFSDIVQDHGDVVLMGPYYQGYHGGTGRLLEIAGLAYLMRTVKPATIFEIGTFRGQTTRILAMNSPKGSRIATLDLEPEKTEHKVGEIFAASPERGMITQLAGDSKTFDYSAWAGQCDFVWVDGCHDYDYLVSDTINALKLAKPGALIGWHDYRPAVSWSGVTRGLREFATAHPGLRHIRGTTICLYRMPR